MNAVRTFLCNKQIREGKLDALFLKQNLYWNQLENTESSYQVNFKQSVKQIWPVFANLILFSTNQYLRFIFPFPPHSMIYFDKC